MKRNFSRSNVNESTLDVSQPGRSSFDLSHRVNITPTMGQFLPVNVEKLMPTSVIRGSINPELQFEKLVTPVVGRTRLDTHTFAVSARRINKDFRQFFEGTLKVNGGKLPMVDLTETFETILSSLLSLGQGDNTMADSRDTISTIAQDFPSGNIGDGWRFAKQIILTADAAYLNLINSTQNQDYCYIRDFASIEHARLQVLAKEYEALADQQTTIYQAESLPTAIYEIMKPYFGEGSILEMLGYPTFKLYGSSVQRFIQISREAQTDSTVMALSVNDIFNDTGFFGMFDGDFQWLVAPVAHIVGSEYEYPVPVVASEDFVRVAYAAWYDGLRNWHIEERSNLLDPDSWDSTSLFALPTTSMSQPNMRNYLRKSFTLLVPHFCCYSRDFYTTVQTDNIYRYVFAPVTTQPTGGVSSSAYGAKNEDALIEKSQDFQTLYQLTVDGVSTMFPSGLFKSMSGGSDVYKLMANDLQTMRRAGMLERWLARNYFYPDTYAGQIMAHYNVMPSDFNVISSEYIGGSETMLTGKQEVSPTGTEDTPAGTRTMVANASLKDEFTYSSSGDFVYIISFVSLVPLVTYDCKNLHLHEFTRQDMPFPEFASDARIQITANDMFRDLEGDEQHRKILGYVPRYYGYRCRGDEAHGRYLTDYRSYLWLHDSYSVGNSGVAGALNAFALNAYAQHVHLPLDAFLGLRQWDTVAFGDCDVVFEVECPLPAAVEFI